MALDLLRHPSEPPESHIAADLGPQHDWSVTAAGSSASQSERRSSESRDILPRAVRPAGWIRLLRRRLSVGCGVIGAAAADDAVWVVSTLWACFGVQSVSKCA